MKHHVILGAGPAGVIAAETLRKQAPNDRITLVGDEAEPPYSRMAIPYLLMGNIDERGTYLRKGATHYQSLRIEQVAARAEKLDAQARVVQMGAGFIGCIIMEALANRGVELSVVEMGDRMVPRMMGPVAGGMIRDWVEHKGVKVYTQAKVEAIVPNEGGSPGLVGRIAQSIGLGDEPSDAPLRVRLSNGQKLPADLVISATGVKPNIAFLKDSGVTCLQGVLTDECLQTNVPGIYAAGDCAEAFDKVTGSTVVSAIQPNAAEQARVAALNMAGQHTTLKGVTQINVLDTLGLISTSFGQWQGVSGGQQATLTAEGRHLSLQFHGDLMVGCNSVGWTEHVGAMRGLVEGQVRLGEWKDKLLQDPTLLMEAYLACAQGQGQWQGAADARRR